MATSMVALDQSEPSKLEVIPRNKEPTTDLLTEIAAIIGIQTEKYINIHDIIKVIPSRLLPYFKDKIIILSKETLKGLFLKSGNIQVDIKHLNEYITKHIPDETKILIFGIVGVGKSSILNTLFETEFTESDWGTGTYVIEPQVKKVRGHTFEVFDVPGVCDAQDDIEIPADHFNDLLKTNINNSEENIIFFILDFGVIRVMEYEKNLVKSIFGNVDYTQDDYLDKIDKIFIIFTHADSINGEGLHKFWRKFLIKKNLSEESIDKDTVNEFIDDTISKYHTQKERVEEKIKKFLIQILIEKKISSNKHKTIIEHLNFSYFGDKTCPSIPDYTELGELKQMYPNANWDKTYIEDYKTDIMTKIIKNIDEKHAIGLAKALTDYPENLRDETDAGYIEIIIELIISSGALGVIGGGTYVAYTILSNPVFATFFCVFAVSILGITRAKNLFNLVKKRMEENKEIDEKLSEIKDSISKHEQELETFKYDEEKEKLERDLDVIKKLYVKINEEHAKMTFNKLSIKSRNNKIDKLKSDLEIYISKSMLYEKKNSENTPENTPKKRDSFCVVM